MAQVIGGSTEDFGGGELAPSRPSPAWAPLALVWLSSFASGTVVQGIFFIAKSAYGFDAWRNLWLGLVMGVTYIAGALLVGPVLRWVAARLDWFSSRAALAALLVAIAAVAGAPLAAPEASLLIWPVVGAYSALTGAMWPIVESYVTGGRRGDDLRRVSSLFNVCWSSALIVTAWAMAPLLAERPLVILAGAGAAHLASAGFVAWLSAYPARPAEDGSHEPHPPVYSRLLAVFRLLLPTSYVLLYALLPILPDRMTALGVSQTWQTPVLSVWLIARLAMFGLLGWWSGWHGRWRTPVWTAGALTIGFVMSLLAPSTPLLVLGLVFVGVGLGGIYTAAFYYAMAVGSAEVEAGGTHEALIGAGYTLGPMAGLVAFVSVSAVADAGGPAMTGEQGAVVLASLLACAGFAWAARSARKTPPRRA